MSYLHRSDWHSRAMARETHARFEYIETAVGWHSKTEAALANWMPIALFKRSRRRPRHHGDNTQHAGGQQRGNH